MNFSVSFNAKLFTKYQLVSLWVFTAATMKYSVVTERDERWF